MALHQCPPLGAIDQNLSIRPQFVQTGEIGEVPRYRLSRGELSPETAYQIIHDELMLDGNARLNLATFVTTWMEPQAERLMAECADKNMIDKDEYRQTAELEMRCVSMLAHLWGASDAQRATGCSTIGSSEACMLGGLALVRRWRERAKMAGRTAERPNLVMGANVQVCWDKFCRYWDIEPRQVPISHGRTHLTADPAVEACDENTIGVIAILGSTFDGSYEPVQEIATALDGLADDRGIDVPIHVDGASGGFVAPFLDPDLHWDFRLPRVQSINASGHKYGLVYPGVGWVVWRNQDALPDDLVFDVNYLGGNMPTFALNFSRPGAQVVVQYFNLLRLGWDGYRRVQQACRSTAQLLASQIAALGPFDLISDGSGIPAFAFRLNHQVEHYSVFDISEALRARGWLVPAYSFPPNLEDLTVLRIVVRNGFGQDLAHLFLEDLQRVVTQLAKGGRPAPEEQESGFNHC
ncbi:MAG: glutamate decarboxylase [Actinobacteria bacterium]|nr:glutamate decarboxylase [Actinomycetota bacterium]